MMFFVICGTHVCVEQGMGGGGTILQSTTLTAPFTQGSLYRVRFLE